MLRNFFQPTTIFAPQRQPGLRKALVIAVVLAVVWWGAAVALRQSSLGVPVWYDQSITFSNTRNLLDPYTVGTFLYPPWAAFFFFPNSIPPLPVSTLIQTGVFFVLLTLVIYKYGGGIKAVLIALTSFIAFDAVIELNIEWIICLGLLLPPALSGPILVIKPQIALGVVLSYKRRDFILMAIVLAAVTLVSFLIWGWWPEKMLNGIRSFTLGTSAYSQFNLAPRAFVTYPVAIVIGLLLSWHAFKRRDPILSILAWLFFVPYITFYSMLLPLALGAIRWPRATLIFSVVLWLVYGGILVSAVLTR